jgi:hypothetical protein
VAGCRARGMEEGGWRVMGRAVVEVVVVDGEEGNWPNSSGWAPRAWLLLLLGEKMCSKGRMRC